jgi:hypothetical protein
MKKIILILLLTTTSLQARQPAINYALINDWCLTLQPLQQNSLQLLNTYLQDLQTFAECNVNDPSCFTTEQGKALQQKLDTDVVALMHDHETVPVFEHLTMLIKEEVGQEKLIQLGRRKKEYKILAAVASGCLECVKRKLS